MKRPELIFLASNNPHKVEEMRQILMPLGIDLKAAADLPGSVEVDEDQPTLEGNALKKARYWHRETGLPAMADDTGLEVEALDGAPGVYSARYSGSDATYLSNIRKLLLELEGADNRKAMFRTVIAFVGEGEHLFEGVCEGTISVRPKGESGFGYDPVFIPQEYDRTFAELDSREKNSISHRGRALQKLIRFLKNDH